MCDGKCQTMRFLGHLSKQEGQPNKVDTIIKAIRNLNAECETCPCKDLKLQEDCILEGYKCLPSIICSFSQAPAGYIVIAIFTCGCLPLENSDLRKITTEAERLEQAAAALT